MQTSKTENLNLASSLLGAGGRYTLVLLAHWFLHPWQLAGG
jgi:hypothetical protein